MAKLKIQTADKHHDAQLRALARTMSMPGHIRVAFAREPDFFAGANIEGRTSRTIAGIKNTRVVGMGCRAVRPMWINGKKRDFGYLSGLRALPEIRGGTALARGYAYLKKLHDEQPVAGYVTTIIEENTHARSTLTSGKAGIPRYEDWGRIITYAININRHRRRRKPNYEIKPGSDIDPADIVTFLNSEGKKRQFFPVWSTDDFGTSLLREFTPADFYVALSGSTIVGVCARWDQRAFKQTVITGYSPLLYTVRPLINMALYIGGYSLLPSPGETLNMVYTAFICVTDNSQAVFKDLIERLYADAREKKYHYITIGFHERDPLKQAIKSFFAVPYYSRLYVVSWPEGDQICQELNRERIPYLEIATL